MAPQIRTFFWGKKKINSTYTMVNVGVYIIADESFYAENNDGHISITYKNIQNPNNGGQVENVTEEFSGLMFKRNETALLCYKDSVYAKGDNLSVTGTVSSESFDKTYSFSGTSTTTLVEFPGTSISFGSSMPKFDEQLTISFVSTSFKLSTFFGINNHYTTVLDRKSGGSSWNWTPASSTYGPYCTGDLAYCNFIVLAFSNGNPYSVRILSYNFDFPASVKPTVTEFTIFDANGYYDQYGVYISTKSSFKGSFSVKGIYGSKVAVVNKYYFGTNRAITVYGPGVLYPPAEYELENVDFNDVTPQAGSQTFGLTVTDTRSRTSTKYEVPLTVVPYVAPTMTVQANRWETGSSIEFDGSTTVRLVCAGEVPSINNHLVTGTITVKARQKNDADWATVGTASVSGTFEEVFTITNQSLDHIYEYQAEIVDEFGTSVMGSSEVGTSTPILEFHSGGMGVGIGTVAPEHGLNIGMNLHVVGNANDGYSRIQISDTDQENSMLLANLAGGTLRVIDPVTGTVDRAFVGGHIMMDNDKAIGSVLSSGGQFPIIRMNGSDQVELSWTSGGLKGRVMKKLWSGSMGANGSATISELPYYRIFGARLDNGGLILLGAMSEGRTNLSCGTVHMSGTQTQVQSASFRVSGNKLTYIAGGTNRIYDGHEFNFRNCVEIWGVL